VNLLVLSAWSPFPADNGSKIRTHHLLRALADAHPVDLACFYQGEREVVALAQAQGMCRQVAAFPKPPFDAARLPSLADLLSPLPRFVRTTFCPALAEKVQEWRLRHRYDAVVCMTWGMAPYAMPPYSFRRSTLNAEPSTLNSQLSTTHQIKGVLDQHNIESGIFRRGLSMKKGPMRLRAWLSYLKFRHFEGQTCARFSACSVVSEKEREELKEILPRREPPRIEVIPNGVDTAWLRPRWERGARPLPLSRNLLFTGSLTYGANVDGLRWFLRAVYPLLRGSFPELRLYITGDPYPQMIPEGRDDPSVVFTGYLTDVRPLLWENAALVVPLHLGGGTRLKILEAMAAGLPVISTSVGVEGLEVKPIQHFLAANEPKDFLLAVAQVLNQPLRTLAMASRARKLVERKYDWGPIGRRFVGLVEEVAE